MLGNHTHNHQNTVGRTASLEQSSGQKSGNPSISREMKKHPLFQISNLNISVTQ